jgi:hypothetical protein
MRIKINMIEPKKSLYNIYLWFCSSHDQRAFGDVVDLNEIFGEAVLRRDDC